MCGGGRPGTDSVGGSDVRSGTGTMPGALLPSVLLCISISLLQTSNGQRKKPGAERMKTWDPATRRVPGDPSKGATTVFSQPKWVAIEDDTTLSHKLHSIHAALRERFRFVQHISVALYDADTDDLKTFLDTSANHAALHAYHAKLSQSGSLERMRQTRQSRVIHDLKEYDRVKPHTQRLVNAGYRSSFTYPIVLNDEFFGFVFFNSFRVHAFYPHVCAQLEPIARLIGMIVVFELRMVRNLVGVTRTTQQIVSRRHYETGAHLDRMSRYAWLISSELSKTRFLSDEYAEHIFLFAPLHDVGKIAIPDEILLKSTALTLEEFEIMKTHTTKGLEMVDNMLGELGLCEMPFIEVLRNIVIAHHEAVDGSGYPRGLRGEEIPLEARIVTIADIFDALTSRRAYKPAWSIERSVQRLRDLADAGKLDAACVDALVKALPQIIAVKERFPESQFG